MSSPMSATPISDTAIHTNLRARVSYLISFIELSADDALALQSVAPFIRPALPVLVDILCERFKITNDCMSKTV